MPAHPADAGRSFEYTIVASSSGVEVMTIPRSVLFNYLTSKELEEIQAITSEWEQWRWRRAKVRLPAMRDLEAARRFSGQRHPSNSISNRKDATNQSEQAAPSRESSYPLSARSEESFFINEEARSLNVWASAMESRSEAKAMFSRQATSSSLLRESDPHGLAEPSRPNSRKSQYPLFFLAAFSRILVEHCRTKVTTSAGVRQSLQQVRETHGVKSNDTSGKRAKGRLLRGALADAARVNLRPLPRGPAEKVNVARALSPLDYQGAIGSR